MKSFRLPLFLRTLGLPAVTLLAPLSAWADTTISSDFTQNGGTFTVSPPTLLVTHGSNDPTLTLTNGANASWEGATIIGNLAGESGNLEILGGSTLANSGSGNLGTYGSVTISRGHGYLGLDAGSSGTALVSGAASTWTNSRGLSVGLRGAGILSIENGGSVSTNASDYIGPLSGSHGTVTVTGAGSTWTNSSIGFDLRLGGLGVGVLNIENGGSVSSAYTAYFGYFATGHGMATVAGAGSTWTNTAGFRVGYEGTGILTIEDGGSVSSGSNVSIGTSNGSSGTATVTGAGSTWNSSGLLIVANSGTGILNISDGGSVSNTGGHIGNSNGSSGEVTVTGEGSLWTNTGNLILGGTTLTDQTTATGELTIADGGTVTVGGTTRVHGGGIILIEENGALETDILLANGEVIVSGSLSAENGVSVEFGGILGGGGEINGDLSLTAGAKFQFDLNSTLTVTGSVTLDSTFGIADLLGLDNTIALGTYILIDGTATDFSTLGLQNWGEENAYDLGNGKSAYFSQGSLQVTVVPEPGTCVLTGVGLATLLLRRRRNMNVQPNAYPSRAASSLKREGTSIMP